MSLSVPVRLFGLVTEQVRGKGSSDEMGVGRKCLEKMVVAGGGTTKGFLVSCISFADRV